MAAPGGAAAAGRKRGREGPCPMDDLRGWASPHARIFERQEKLFRYLGLRGGDSASPAAALRAWSVEASEPLVKRLRYGEQVQPFDSPDAVQGKLITQSRYFVAATAADMFKHLFGPRRGPGADAADEEADDVQLNLDGTVTRLARAPPAAAAGPAEQPEPRAVYEIIREGTPCHIYFDVELEYDKQEPAGALPPLSRLLQPMADAARAGAAAAAGAGGGAPAAERCAQPAGHPAGRQGAQPPAARLERCERDCGLRHDPGLLTAVLYRELAACLWDTYQLRLRPEHMLKLVSDYPHKLSAHYVVHLPGGAAFCNNAHLGRFVAHFVSRCAEKARGGDTEVHRALFYHRIDDAVGAARCIERNPAMRFAHRLRPRLERPGGTNFDRRLGSVIDLAVYTKNRTFRCLGASKLGKRSPLRVDEKESRFPFYRDEELWLGSLVCNVQPNAQLLEFGADCSGSAGLRAVGCGGPAPAAGGQLGGGCGATAKACPAPERLPAVAAAVAELLRRPPFRTATAARWMTFGDSLLVPVAGSRYCLNVDREHRSNGVYLVLSAARGTVVQKCHDPECSGFRSAEWPLPPAAQQQLAAYARDLRGDAPPQAP